MLVAPPTVAEDVIPCPGVLSPQAGAHAEQQARGQVEESRGGCQHSLHGPDELLGLQGGRGGEEANALPVDYMATGYRRRKGGRK